MIMTGATIGKWIIFAGCMLIGLGLLIWFGEVGSVWKITWGY